jgi:hypothetical protein
MNYLVLIATVSLVSGGNTTGTCTVSIGILFPHAGQLGRKIPFPGVRQNHYYIDETGVYAAG